VTAGGARSPSTSSEGLALHAARGIVPPSRPEPQVPEGAQRVHVQGPDLDTSLRDLLTSAGHEVPDVILEATPQDGDYEESIREVAPLDVETDRHVELVESL